MPPNAFWHPSYWPKTTPMQLKTLGPQDLDLNELTREVAASKAVVFYDRIR